MTTIKGGFNATNSNEFNVGDGQITADKVVYFENGEAQKPNVKWDYSGSNLQYSHDGVVDVDFLTKDQHDWLVDGYTSGTWDETKGGTGQTSYTTGDMLYASGTNTLAKRTVGATGTVLTVAGGVPTWASPQLTDTKAEYASQQGMTIGVLDVAGRTAFATPTKMISTANGATGVTKLAYLGHGMVIGGCYGETGVIQTPICKSYDYGKTWQVKYTYAADSAPLGISYVGGGVCLAGNSTRGRCLRSTNYGDTWSEITAPPYSGYIYQFCRCSDSTTGTDVVVGVGDTGVPNRYIIRSTDLGVTWSDIYYAGSGGGKYYAAIYLGNGIVLAGGDYISGSNVRRSTDYGATFSTIAAQDDVSHPGTISDFCYCGNGIVIATTYNTSFSGTRITRSTDYGVTWETGKITTTDYMLSCCYMGSGRVLVGNSAGHIYESLDYGVTFSDLGVLVPAGPGDFDINTLIKMDNNTVIMGLAGSGSYVCFSDESISIQLPQDESVGGTGQSTYATGDLLYASATNTLAKRSIGSTGQVLSVSGGVPAWATMSMPNLKADDIAARGINWGIYDNLGEEFTTVATGLSCNGITALCAIPGGVILASTKDDGVKSGHIIRSEDYGRTWKDLGSLSNSVGTGLMYGVYGVSYVGNGICLASDAATKKIYRSTDFGETWNDMGAAPSSSIINKFIAVDDNPFNKVILGVGGTDFSNYPNYINSSNLRAVISTNNGATWALCSGATYQAQTGFFTDVLYMEYNRTILASVMSFGAAGSPNLWVSIDGGSSFGISRQVGNVFDYIPICGLCYCGNGIVVGAEPVRGAFTKSVDYGVTFTQNDAGVNTRSLIYCGYDTIFGLSYASPSILYTSVDFGTSYRKSKSLGAVCYALCVADDQTIIVGSWAAGTVYIDRNATNAIPQTETLGGTGQTTYTTGDLLYASAANTLAKRAAGTDGYTLQMVSGVPNWAQTIDEINGGTNQTTYATGDLLYASAANTLSKRSIGSTGQVLSVSGGVPTWQTTVSVPAIKSDGYVLSVYNNATAWRTPNQSAWMPLMPEDFDSTAVDNETIDILRINCLIDASGGSTELKGYPIKILQDVDGYAVKYNDGSNQLGPDGYIIGINSKMLYDVGNIYVSVIDEGAGNFRVDMFSHPARTAEYRIGYTASYSGTGDQPIIPDNGSGISGNVDITAVGPADSNIIIECFKWCIISSFSGVTGNIKLCGPPISHLAVIRDVLIGPPSYVTQVDFFVAGSYALTASTSLLEDMMDQYYIWRKGLAKFVKFSAISKTVSATPAIINISINGDKVCTANSGDGLEMAVAGTWYSTTNDLDVRYLSVTTGLALEIETTQGDTVTPDANLTVSCLFTHV